MSIGESLALVLIILTVSASIAYSFQRGTPPLGNFTEDLDEDLVKKPKAKPKAKAEKAEKVANEPVEQAPKAAKVFPAEATINTESTNVEFEPVKPKKKRKYYPRKPKTQK